MSSGDSVVLSPRQNPKRRTTHKENGKMKMLEYGMDTGFSDQSDSEMAGEKVKIGQAKVAMIYPPKEPHSSVWI